MMSEKEKMRSGQLAKVTDSEILSDLTRAKALIAKINAMYLGSPDLRATLEELLPNIHATAKVNPPFFCDYGYNIELGEHVFINFNCVILDGAPVKIGHHTLLGPSVQIYTPQHPMDYLERRESFESAYPVTIGDDCWIGGGAIICPGVTIGNRCIIGAGSVVTKDVPDDSLAVGNPAVVKRKLS
jgi:maltose O-acetyltransferase